MTTDPTAPVLIFEVRDGEPVRTTFAGPYSLREQIDFEQHFRISFIAMERAAAEMNAVAAQESGGEPAVMPRIEWILWFGWHRARPAVPANFTTFLDTLEGYDIETPDIPDESSGDRVADAVDPTVTEGHSGPDR